MVTVTKDNFLEQSNNLIQLLPTAAYVSLDLETTGISLPTTNNPTIQNPLQRDDTPEERYKQFLKPVAERYSIIHIGITLFHENPDYIQYVKRQAADRKRKSNGSSSGNSNSRNNIVIENENNNLLGGILDHHRHENELEEGSINIEDDDYESIGIHDVDEQIDIDVVRFNNVQEINNNEIPDEEQIGNDFNNLQENDNLLDANIDNIIVESREPPELIVHKYNFILFPSGEFTLSNCCCETKLTPREVVLNPSSVAYLNEQGINYNEWATKGVPYTTINEMQVIMMDVKSKIEQNIQQGKEKEAEVMDPMRPYLLKKKRLEPTRAEDVAFVARSMASLREWIDSTAPRRIRQNHANRSPTNVNEERDGIAYYLPSCSSFLRQCLSDAIEYEYPSLIIEQAPTPNENQMCVLRLSATEKKDRDKRIRRNMWQKAHHDYVGFTRVFDALSDACCGVLATTGNLDDEYSQFLNDSYFEECYPFDTLENNLTSRKCRKPSVQKHRRVPLIVHNGMMDLLFLLTHFHAHTLPSTLIEAKSLIHRFFPIIFDTKVLSSEFSSEGVRNGSTALGDLYARHCLRLRVEVDDDTTSEGFDFDHAFVPRVIIANNQSNVIRNVHEAAYEAFMAGSVFHALSRRLLERKFYKYRQRKSMIYKATAEWHGGVGSLLFLDEEHPQSKFCKLLGKNKLFLMKCLFLVDLEKNDDQIHRGMSLETTFRVSGIEPTVCTRDIIRLLLTIRDETSYTGNHANYEHNLGYEIIWLNQNTFLVVTLNENEVALKRHGRLIHDTLASRFPSCSVISLKEHITQKKHANNESSVYKLITGVFSGITTLFSRKRDRNEDANSTCTRKRMRL